MHIVITGANGFIGRHLTARVVAGADSLGVNRLTLLDQVFDKVADNPLVYKVQGSFADPAVLAQALSDAPADLVFHLASIPSGLAESDYQLGVDVNILGTMALLDKLRSQKNTASVVFASSIAVYGKPSVPEVNDNTLPSPNLSYGAQKVIGETLVADYCRRHWIRGCSVRIPGIVARPPDPNGAVSIFFSDLIRNLSGGQSFTCPVSATGRSWLMSVTCCVDNLLRAAGVDQTRHTTWTLPAMYVSIGEIVDQIAAIRPGIKVRELISYAPDPWVEENFAGYPPIHCPAAEAAGFRHDGSLEKLINNALEGIAG